MREHGISALVVLDGDDLPVSILCESDLTHALAVGQDMDVTLVDHCPLHPVLHVELETPVYDALDLLLEQDVRHLLVVDADGAARGIITLSDMMRGADWETFLQAKPVSGVMQSIIVRLPAGAALVEAIRLLDQQHISWLLVVQDDEPAGILTERDIARLISQGREHDDLTLADVMSSPLKTIAFDACLLEASLRMMNQRIRRLMVEQDGTIIGIVNQLDVLRGLEGRRLEHLKHSLLTTADKLQESNLKLREKIAFEQFVQDSPVVIYRMHFCPEAKTPGFMLQTDWPADLGGSFMLDYVSNQVEAVLGEKPQSLLGYPNWWAERIHPDDRKRALEGYGRLFARGQVVHEYRMRHNDGHYVWLEVSARMHRDAAGMPTEITGAWMNVSECVLAEQRVQEGELRYRRLVEASPVCIHEIDLQGRILSMNSAGLRMNCVSADGDVIGRPYLNGVCEAERAAIARLLEQAMQGQGSDFEFHGAGAMSAKVFASSVIPMFDADGRVEKLMGISEDITERKQAETSLKASEMRFRQVFDHTFDGLVVIQHGVFTMVNQKTEQVLGMPASQLIGRSMLDFVHPDDRTMVMERYQRRMGGEAMPPFQTRIVASNRAVEWVEIRGNLVEFEGEPSDLVVIRDVTEERRNAEKLRASRAQLKHILDADFDAVIVHQDMGIVFTNPAAQAMFGFSAMAETIGLNPQDFMDPAFKSLAAAIARKVVRTGCPSRRLELGAIHQSDGHIFPMEIASALITWNDKPAVVSIVRDISVRKRQEQFDADQRSILEQIADVTVPLPDVLGSIVKVAQRQRRGMVASVWLLDEDGIHLRRGAAPDLPDTYCQVFDGALVGPLTCSCGAAIMRRERVIVGDIAHDPLWEGFRELAAGHGLAASWAEPIINTAGHVLGTFAMYYDSPRLPDADDLKLIGQLAGLAENAITHKQAESIIRGQASRLQKILDADFDAVIVCRDDRVLFANQQAQAIFGSTTQQVAIEKGPYAFVHPHYLGLTEKVARRSLRTGKPSKRSEILAILPSSGETVPIEIACTPINWQGELALVVMVRDISERKKAEEVIRQEAERLQQLLDADLDAVVVQQHGVIVYANRRAHIMAGKKEPDGMLGDSPHAFVAAEYRSMTAKVAEHCLRTGKPVRPAEIMALRADSKVPFPIEISSAPINWGGKPAVVSMVRDISERKKAEMDIAEREQRFRELVRLIPDALTVHQHGRLVFGNEAAVQLFRFDSLEQALGVQVMDYIHPHYHEQVNQRLQQLYAGNPLPGKVEERFIRTDGSEFEAEVNAALTEYKGKPAVMTVLRDITERKKAEQELRESAERIQAVARNSTAVVFQFGLKDDGSWYFPFIAESVERFMGVSAERVMQDAQLLFGLVHPDDAESFVLAVSRAIREQSSFAWQGRFIRPDGELRWLECSSDPQVLEDGTLVWNGVAVDETGKQQLEEQLRQAQKMEAVGTLAGGIAHDFNNMLAGMLGQLFMLKAEVADRPESVERVDSVEKQGYRAAEMIQQMLTFARKSQVSMRTVAMTSLLKETLKLHRVALPESIALEASLNHENIMVEGDVAMMQQMVLNLLTNARDAVADKAKPKIYLTLEPVSPDDDCYQRFPEFAGKSLARLTVKDNGCGITKAVQATIFDPFFTTKEVGRGTGLGLAMVYGGMQTHGGTVEVVSRAGKGAAFQLYFPRIDEPGAFIEPHDGSVVEGAGQGVLVADDEPVLRQVLEEVLTSVGYRVFTAVDGSDAVRQFRKHRDKIAIALLDVVMPNMSGPDACRKIRQLEPNLPVIFHTGYGQDALVDDVIHQPLCISLNKPVSIEELTDCLADLLRQRQRLEDKHE